MLKKKKTTASGKLVLVKSVRRTRSHRMKFCVQRGLGALNGHPPDVQYLRTLLTRTGLPLAVVFFFFNILFYLHFQHSIHIGLCR